ncbi:checkpoint protein HUS1-like [Bolinopsis microptera]|uniref:checkpoint protein HUS1-like n=1 Tax=Bolinopsis microptera TaxID=2820187 RepID=UPI003078BA6B
MRFKAKLFDVQSITQLQNIISAVSKFCKTCCLKLTEDKMYFILNDRLVCGGTTIWCEVTQSSFFDEYRIEGKDDKGAILMSVSPENLSKSLCNTMNASSVKIKLAKKQSACLSVEIALPSPGGSGIQRLVTHDVPVHLIPLTHWAEYEEPGMPEFDISFYLPPLKRLRNVLERIKNLSNHVTVRGAWTGELTLSVKTELVTTKTYFTDLDIPQLDSEVDTSRASAEVTVDIKKLLLFVQSQGMGASKAICNIVHNRALQLFLLQDDVQLQYYLPSIDTS